MNDTSNATLTDESFQVLIIGAGKIQDMGWGSEISAKRLIRYNWSSFSAISKEGVQ
jgi:hypothetical protein